ncbi:MAG: hypothetical protein ABH837_00980 [bacterium]
MADDTPQEEKSERKMFPGNWKCKDCSTDITELPFPAKPDQEVRCQECHKKWKEQQN